MSNQFADFFFFLLGGTNQHRPRPEIQSAPHSLPLLYLSDQLGRTRQEKQTINTNIPFFRFYSNVIIFTITFCNCIFYHTLNKRWGFDIKDKLNVLLSLLLPLDSNGGPKLVCVQLYGKFSLRILHVAIFKHTVN